MGGEDGHHIRGFISRDAILLILFFLRECMCVSQLVLYDETRTWNEAYRICKNNGGRLISVDSTDKYNMLGTYSKASPWKAASGINSQVWIGLHTTDTQSLTREWADCEPEAWTQWHPSEPKDSGLYRCAYLKSVTANFWMSDCGVQMHFICENVDNSCMTPLSNCYEAKLNSSVQAVSSNSASNPSSTCVGSIETTVSTVESSVERTSTQPTQTHGSDITTNFDIGSSSTPQSSSTDSSTESISTSSQKTNIDNKTSSTELTNYVTSSTEKVTSSTTSSTEFTNYVTTLTDNVTSSTASSSELTNYMTSLTDVLLSTTSSTELTNNVTSVTDSVSSSTVSSTELTMSSSTASSTELTNYVTSITDSVSSSTVSSTELTNNVTSSAIYTTTVGECLCTCSDDGANVTLVILQEKIEARKRLLTVNKSLLSSTIRKKESAGDSRASAKGIGVVGIVFIVFVFGGVVFMDLHTLYVYLSTKYKRTKKFPKRVNKRKGVVHCYAQNIDIKREKTTNTQ